MTTDAKQTTGSSDDFTIGSTAPISKEEQAKLDWQNAPWYWKVLSICIVVSIAMMILGLGVGIGLRIWSWALGFNL